MPLTTPTLAPTKIGPNGSGLISDLVASTDLQAAAGGGDAFPCHGQEVLVVSNGDIASHTVTIKAVANNFGNTLTANDIVQAVGAGKVAVIGPFDPAKYADSNGLVQITWSAVTSVKVGILTFSRVG